MVNCVKLLGSEQPLQGSRIKYHGKSIKKKKNGKRIIPLWYFWRISVHQTNDLKNAWLALVFGNDQLYKVGVVYGPSCCVENDNWSIILMEQILNSNSIQSSERILIQWFLLGIISFDFAEMPGKVHVRMDSWSYIRIIRKRSVDRNVFVMPSDNFGATFDDR